MLWSNKILSLLTNAYSLMSSGCHSYSDTSTINILTSFGKRVYSSVLFCLAACLYYRAGHNVLHQIYVCIYFKQVFAVLYRMDLSYNQKGGLLLLLEDFPDFFPKADIPLCRFVRRWSSFEDLPFLIFWGTFFSSKCCLPSCPSTSARDCSSDYLTD